MPLKFTRLEIPDVVLVEPSVFKDERGEFMEVYKQSEFAQFGIKEQFVQDNRSISKKNVLRGLHYQIHPKAQAKLVQCVRGAVFDVAVDIRKNSPTFGKWVGSELTEENHRLLFIPAGFAHGFVVLSDVAEIHYKCSGEYSKEHDRGILWNDPAIGIQWPLVHPILSEKDTNHPLLSGAETL
jgi:dTDP-4-dehydrorhamnose 3,5-epimerase